MHSVERSVVVDIPIAEADREWTRFTLRTTIGEHKVTSPEQEWSLSDEIEHEAHVSFHQLDDGRTRVTVRVEYPGDEAAGVAILEHVARELEEFRWAAQCEPGPASPGPEPPGQAPH